MRSFRRRLFATVCVLSLILCLATVGLWVRSYSWFEAWRRNVNDEQQFMFRQGSGRLAVSLRKSLVRRESTDGWSYFAEPASQVRGAGFGIDHDLNGWLINVPHWFLALLFALAPARWLLGRRRAMRSKRRKLGLCPTCGYDLRASPERCPECGTASPL